MVTPEGERLTRNLFAGVNELADPPNPTDLEKKHIPGIEAPGTVRKGRYFSVVVTVGGTLPHPNERQHSIEFIELYADDSFLARVDLTAVNTRPEARLCISLQLPAGELRAYARCNMHGVWLGRKPITVSSA